ncbi:wax ester synthase-like acyl-CoA acyltransferase domain-containing protein [Cokeromyces recurvatus]|uniref:wax ester synthase-like acyl-CoA acyltransferase domain-containing protein n=1 Tax=Cokeromyces recurvatus TaxID=90255 RepID=UPI002220548D|nr:wax ester synthase-like acyl-CoA acyltransferase domain-containing protein [Cokeromyces recurvatus]KAI7901614.1 wax ester synthase-like acyl-CoA acyltransferase domain-containing protein [Cokeromyces recurvatus]
MSKTEQPSDVRLGGMDNIFLKIEHPRRTMAVTSLWIFKNPVDINRIYTVMTDYCKNAPRFARVPKNESFFRKPIWATPLDWKPEDNIIKHTLEEPTRKALQKYCAQQVQTPFNYTKPLWELHTIYGLEGNRCAVFFKVSHAISDGEGLVRGILSTTSLKDTMKNMEKQQAVISHRTKSPKNQVLNLENKVPKKLLETFPSFIITILSFFYMLFWKIYIYYITICHDLYESFLTMIPVMRKDFYYKGLQSTKKEMAWSDDIKLSDIKIIRQAFGGTLNDVMLTVVTRCIKNYLESIGKRRDNYITLLIPISLRKPSDWRLKNVVSGAWGFFSMKDLETKQLLKQVRTEMTAIKSSRLSLLLYIWFEYIFGSLPGLSLPLSVYNHYCDIGHGVFTNVPGPQTRITYAGEEIEEYKTFPPQNGKGSIGIALLSYCGKVSIGALADVHSQYPNLTEGICQRFVEEFEFILEEAKLELSKKKDKSS